MRKRYGKYFARWTGTDGKRHEKACDTPSAAKKLQAKMTAERLAKKARPTRSSRPSRKAGPLRKNGRVATA
jgi:hypothetical protein